MSELKLPRESRNSDDFQHKNVLLSGFGADEANVTALSNGNYDIDYNFSYKLNFAHLVTISNIECNEFYQQDKGYDPIFRNIHICAQKEKYNHSKRGGICKVRSFIIDC